MHAQMLDTRRSSPIFQVPGNKARRVNAVPLLCLHIHKNNSNIAQREQQEPEGQMLFCLGNVLQWFKHEIFGGQTEMRRVPGHLSRSEALGGQ